MTNYARTLIDQVVRLIMTFVVYKVLSIYSLQNIPIYVAIQWSILDPMKRTKPICRRLDQKQIWQYRLIVISAFGQSINDD